MPLQRGGLLMLNPRKDRTSPLEGWGCGTPGENKKGCLGPSRRGRLGGCVSTDSFVDDPSQSLWPFLPLVRGPLCS